MENKKYFNIFELISLIQEPNKSAFLRMIKENEDIFFQAKGSAIKHQAWEGGYVDHITECLNMAINLFETLDNLRHLPFSLEDCLIVLFLHDLEKPWLYGGKISFNQREERYSFREEILERYGVSLTDDQMIALRYVEGEGKDYSPTKRVMNPLGAFCHSCDTLSARMWHDRPYDKQEQWGHRSQFTTP